MNEAPSPAGPKVVTAVSAAAAALVSVILVAGSSRDYLNWDVALFLQQAQLILKGRIPFLDFWDVNPPWIMYLNVPPVFLANRLGLPVAVGFNYFVLLLVGGSLLLVRGTARGKDPAWFFPVAAAILVEALHARLGTDFGQREHLFAISFVPYLLIQWDGDAKFGARAFVATFWCALFACLKPDFGALLLASEVMYFYHHRRVQRAALAAISLPAVLYLVLFMALPLSAGRNFWLEHVPFMLRRYSAFNESWAVLYQSWRPYFFLVPWLSLWLCLSARGKGRERGIFGCLGVLVSLAFVFALMAGKNWAYHLLVVDMLCCLGVALLLPYMLAAGVSKSVKLAKTTILFLPVAVIYSSANMSYFGQPVSVRSARVAYKNSLEPLLALAAPGDQVVIFAAEPYSIYPELLNHNFWPGTRYPIMYPLAIFNSTESRIRLLRTRYPAWADLEPSEREFVDRVREDLVRNKPELLIFLKRFTPYLPVKFNTFEYARSVGWYEPIRGNYRTVFDDPNFLVLKLRSAEK